ncbi:MAG: hypothetical protein OXI50_14805 [Gammaproteobacteria bacterium]|nr:hypothetical protein [Gammaproteobacteria bacterium]
MRTPHHTGIRVAIPALLLLASGSALGALNAEDTRSRPHDPKNARVPSGDAVGGSTAQDTIRTRNLLLWGGIDAGGVPFLDPVFVIDAPPSLPFSIGEYVVIGRAGDGTVLFSLPFEMPVVADGDGSSSFVFMLPVEPGWAGSLASVTLTGPGGSATLDEGTHRPMAIVRDTTTGRIQGILRDLPPTVMTQEVADTAVFRTSMSEVLFSRGIPGPGAWRR